ncbi:conjugal transfer protein TraH [Xinfangfangia sp. D13-10-4-6]|uniref:conjugal transfer protein TraH n=1 Tax=Pseudogemmobacter hezensis TaxID=2737662 RepID=UPI001556E542|nr:conjugal transfer protein TraH [Pseudogemmobacter hezensis]NPD15042.1 conjugal transfer protein TraH [Pseudogemmobacter hezensis]
MSNKLTTLIASAAASLLLLSPFQAPAQSLGDDLKGFWERTGGGINVTRPQAYQGQMGGYVTLGSLYVRTKPRNATMMQIQLPSVRAGCGGIDIFGGSFSFISKEEMIYLMEAIMQNAASFAFELALESLSPAVAEQVSKLRDLLQEVNAMNINSCEAGQLLVGSLWPKMDGASQHICQTVGGMNGKFADAVARRHGCGTGGQQNETLGEATGELADQVPININYAWRAVKKNGFLSSNPTIGELFMSMTGTIITTGAANDNEGPRHRTVAPRAFSPEMLLALVDGGTVPILKCDDFDLCLNPVWTDITLSHDDAYFALVEDVVRGMSDAIRDDTALTEEMIGIIGLTSAPVYETLKTARAYKYQFVDDEIALLSELVAVELAMLYMNETLSEMSRAASNVDTFGDIIREFQETIRQTQNGFGTLRRQAAEKYNDALSAIEKLQLHKALLTAGSSTKFASMMGQGG